MRRIRRNRFLRGAAWGLAAGAGATLIVRIIALFTPVADKWLWAVLPAAGFALLGAAGNALRPVTDRTAAEAADGCGLKERTVTALEQAGSETEICALQREDACRALRGLDVHKIRPGSVKKQLLTALGCGLLAAALLVIPNPRDREAEARQALRKTLKEGTEEIARAAQEDEERLSPEKRSELRRLTEELKRELLDSRDETDALVALDRAEQRLEQMQNRTAGDAAAAADAAGSESAAGEGTRDGETADGTGTAAVGKTAQASADSSGIKTGKLSTQKALTALKSAVNPSEARKGTQATDTGIQGTGQGEGQDGQGTAAAGSGRGNKAANGAGEGSTNLEAEAGGKKESGSAKGTRDPKYKEAEYETIYDPERIEKTVRDEMTNQNRLGNEESLQVETGPGKGSLGGSVPWNEVFREYEETETRSAERENLTTKERQWVNEYYSLLTSQQ
jgi:hypothetical protein